MDRILDDRGSPRQSENSRADAQHIPEEKRCGVGGQQEERLDKAEQFFVKQAPEVNRPVLAAS